MVLCTTDKCAVWFVCVLPPDLRINCTGSKILGADARFPFWRKISKEDPLPEKVALLSRIRRHTHTHAHAHTVRSERSSESRILRRKHNLPEPFFCSAEGLDSTRSCMESPRCFTQVFAHTPAGDSSNHTREQNVPCLQMRMRTLSAMCAHHASQCGGRSRGGPRLKFDSPPTDRKAFPSLFAMQWCTYLRTTGNSTCQR